MMIYFHVTVEIAQNSNLRHSVQIP